MLLLLGDNLRRVYGAFVIGVLDCCSLVGAVERAHCVLLLAGDRDDVTVPWHLEDIVTMMSHHHDLGQGWIPKDGIVRKADVGDVEVDELSAVVVALAEGDREADLPYRGGGTVSNS